MSTPGPLGWIEPKDRTQMMDDAHARAVATMPKFSLPVPKLAKGDKVLLTKGWNAPEVVEEVGRPFTRKHQLTGSCVEAGYFNMACTLIAGQRLLSSNPTKAFLPFTGHNYAMSRHYLGWDSPGDGSLGSTMARSGTADGLRDWVPDTDGMPVFTYGEEDGIVTSKKVELAWSTFNNPNLKKILDVSKAHLFGTAAEARSTEEIEAYVLNGYPGTFACSYFVGDAELKGSGNNACVIGKWNGRGGHQQSVHGVWEHPDYGTLFAVVNSWDKSTYPRDPAGLPWCSCWVPEENVAWAMRQDGEVYHFSHLNWFPAQPKVLEIDWMQLGM